MGSRKTADLISFRTICDLGELESVRAFWKSSQKTRDADIDYFCGIVRSRGPGCTPHVIVLLRDGRPDALLVGLRARRKIPVRICSFAILEPELDVLEFVHGGLLGNNSVENSEALVQAVLKSLASGSADLALWEHLEAQSALHLSALRLPSIGLRDHCRKLRDHWFLDQPHGREQFFKNLERSQRSKLRRKYKKFQDTFTGRIDVRSFQMIGELNDAIRDMEEIARKSVKRQLGFGFFNSTQSRDQLLIEAALGWLRVFILYIDGIPVSFWKGTLYERCLHADHVGFDSAWSDYSPGIFLFLNVIERLRDTDIQTIDFGTGSGQFYQSFAKLRRPEARVQIYAPKFRGLRLNLAQTLAYYTTQLIQKTWYLDRVRKAIWKVRKSALAPIPAEPSEKASVKPHRAVLYGERR
jgi:CelD/BcsL family acetyltransferase involved in cellulose biosynthesis